MGFLLCSSTSCLLNPLVFVEARKYARAIVAYEHALLWRELFVLAKQESLSDEDVQTMAQRIGGTLH